jgi:hypothetical protein
MYLLQKHIKVRKKGAEMARLIIRSCLGAIFAACATILVLTGHWVIGPFFILLIMGL